MIGILTKSTPRNVSFRSALFKTHNTISASTVEIVLRKSSDMTLSTLQDELYSAVTNDARFPTVTNNTGYKDSPWIRGVLIPMDAKDSWEVVVQQANGGDTVKLAFTIDTKAQEVSLAAGDPSETVQIWKSSRFFAMDIGRKETLAKSSMFSGRFGKDLALERSEELLKSAGSVIAHKVVLQKYGTPEGSAKAHETMGHSSSGGGSTAFDHSKNVRRMLDADNMDAAMKAANAASASAGDVIASKASKDDKLAAMDSALLANEQMLEAHTSGKIKLSKEQLASVKANMKDAKGFMAALSKSDTSQSASSVIANKDAEPKHRAPLVSFTCLAKGNNGHAGRPGGGSRSQSVGVGKATAKKPRFRIGQRVQTTDGHMGKVTGNTLKDGVHMVDMTVGVGKHMTVSEADVMLAKTM